MYPAFPLLNYTGTSSPSRFPFLWPLPGLYADSREFDESIQYRPSARMSKTERYLVDSVVEAMEQRPRIVIVDSGPVKQGFGKRSFDYVQYFSGDERFAFLWSNYHMIKQIENYQVFKGM